MNRKSTMVAGAAVLLAVAVAVAIIQSGPEDAKKSASPEMSATGRASKESFETGSAAGKSATGSRQRDAVKNPELASKYGESRTNLSKHVSSNVISLMQDAIEIGEMVGSGQAGGPFGGEARVRMGIGRVYNDLNLTPEQKTRVAAAHAEFQKRELQRSKDAVGRLEKDPTPLMQMMLASDALARSEISEEEYKKLQTDSGEDLQGVVNPLDEVSFRGGRPLNDDAFLQEFRGILDPEQSEKLQASLDQQAPAADDAGNRGNITAMPAMELEKLDTTIESVKKLTTGFKSVMEGFGGLQDLGPLMEQQGRGGQPTPPTEE